MNNLTKFMKKLIICSLSLLFLASCMSTENKDFSCPPQKGKSCLTIKQSDVISDSEQVLQSPKIDKRADLINNNHTDYRVKGFIMSRVSPTRTQEVVGKIWIAPFLDEENNLFDESYVYTVFKPALWSTKIVNK